jgi:protein tyrosine/serine phosphatase
MSTLLSAALTIVLFSIAQAAQWNEQARIKVKNFGAVNEHMYRGAQPKDTDYSDLAAMGIKTVVDLQEDGVSNEQGLVEALGMKFVRIRMSDSERPEVDKSEEFLRIVTDPANQPVFFHCHGGRHRTGAMAALYRMRYEGWSVDQAWEEMKHYDFNRGFGHGALKQFVFDSYTQISHKAAPAGSAAASVTANK